MRKQDGLALPLNNLANLCATDLPSWFGIYNGRRAKAKAREVSDWVRLAARLFAPTGALSGGNQQKVVLGKWLSVRPRVMLCDEPTRAIDVGAKAEIYQLLRRLADDGAAIVVASSELIELLGLCDRILILHEGRLAGDRPLACRR